MNKREETGYVLIPSAKKLKYLKICGYEDFMPRPNHYVPESWGELEERVYDPVIIANGAEDFIITYGLSLELDRARRQFTRVGENPFAYEYIVTFAFYRYWVLKKFTKYSSVWGALAELRLIIDAEDWATASDPRIIKATDWVKMSEEQRLETLRNALGDEKRAKLALEYLKPPRKGSQIAFTGIHLTEESPYGVVIVLAIEKLFPITNEQVAKAVGKPKYLPGWIRTPRLLRESVGNTLIATAPLVLTKDTIEAFCHG